MLADEAQDVTLGHVLRVTEGRPAVTLKLALGADGLRAEGRRGAPVWITGAIRAGARASAARPHRRDPGRARHHHGRRSEPDLPASRHGRAARRCALSSIDACARRLTQSCSTDEMVPVWFVCAADESKPAPTRCRSSVPRSFRSPWIARACSPSGKRSIRSPSAASRAC